MHFLLLSILYGSWLVAGDVDRRVGALNSFTVVNHGRLDHIAVLMFLEDVTLDACFEYCVSHLRCRTVSYSSTARLCELNDMEFDEDEAIDHDSGWLNYGTPPRVDGGFTEWKYSNCSRPCAGGHRTAYRTCENPKPQNGGKYCHDEEVKTQQCNTHRCLICYGAKDDSYGEVEVFKSGRIKGVRLIHVSGELSCRVSDFISRWGCDIHFITFVTTEDNTVLFPDPSIVRYYYSSGNTKRLPVYYYYNGDKNGDLLEFQTTSPIDVKEGEKLRIWYGEDLSNWWESNNGEGTHCIHVDVIYEE